MKLSAYQQLSLLFLRLSIGILFFYAGISKLLTPNWSAVGYLKNAQNLTPFYQFLASTQNIGWVNFLNEWGLTLVGISLILGVFIKLSSVSGIFIMILYYIPILHFPYVGKNPASFLVDEHIILIAGLLIVFFFEAGKYFSLKNSFKTFLPKNLQAYL